MIVHTGAAVMVQLMVLVQNIKDFSSVKHSFVVGVDKMIQVGSDMNVIDLAFVSSGVSLKKVELTKERA